MFRTQNYMHKAKSEQNTERSLKKHELAHKIHPNV